jgi:hypothetical protein
MRTMTKSPYVPQQPEYVIRGEFTKFADEMHDFHAEFDEFQEITSKFSTRMDDRFDSVEERLDGIHTDVKSLAAAIKRIEAKI